ncbi:MAG TPA: hypothetical protein VFZ66_21410 [Herpetosiphonaceae bacterium]
MDDQQARLEREKVILGQDDLELLQEGGFQVLSAMMSNPTTTRQLAMRLNMNRARVQYMIDKLMQRDLILIHQQVQEAGRGEVYYTAAARDIVVALDQGTPQQTQAAGAQIVLNSIQMHLARAFAEAPPDAKIVVKLVQCTLDEAHIQSFIERISELAREFTEAEDSRAPQEYALALALYPIIDD